MNKKVRGICKECGHKNQNASKPPCNSCTNRIWKITLKDNFELRQGKTMKKAIFRIPEKMELTREQLEQISAFFEYDRKECKLEKREFAAKDCFFWFFEDGSNFEDDEWIRKDWLEVIKEPKTAIEWLKEEYPNEHENGAAKTTGYSATSMIFAFKSGEANERLKHEPRQNFQDWFYSINERSMKHYDEDEFKWVWHECEKNRGF